MYITLERNVNTIEVYCPECYVKSNAENAFCESCGYPFGFNKDYIKDNTLRGRYRIISSLSSGGTGEIFLSYDIHLNKSCAVKRIYRKGIEYLTREERYRKARPFEREARLLANLRHTGLPCVTDYFVEDDYCYLVMDYIEGKDLDVILKEKGGLLPEKQVMEWAIQICRVLEYLHLQKPSIIHGDIKTSNLIVRNKDGQIMLVDFGTASLQSMTGEKEAFGTIGYAPPEQYMGEQEIRSDLYSLGATMYELLTGMLPEEPFNFLPLRIFSPETSRSMEKIVEKCLAFNPRERFKNATELKQKLLAAHKENFGNSDSSYHTSGSKTQYSSREDDKAEKIKVFIMDHDTDMGNTYKVILKLFKNIKITGCASGLEETVEKILQTEYRPHVVLMDNDIPVVIKTTKKILQILPDIKIIVMASELKEVDIKDCFNAGVTGYILKDETSWEDLERYIKASLSGETPLSPSVATLILKALHIKNHPADNIKDNNNLPSPENKKTDKTMERYCKDTKREISEYKTGNIIEKKEKRIENIILREKKKDAEITELLIDLESKDPSVRKKAVIKLAETGDRRVIIALKEARKKEGPLNFAMKIAIDDAIKKLQSESIFWQMDAYKNYSTIRLPGEKIIFEEDYGTKEISLNKIHKNLNQ